MLKRALLVVLALSLPLLVAGMKQPATAGDTYAELADLKGLPDIDAESGRFLTVSGNKNRGIEVDPGETLPPGEDPQQLVLRIYFEDTSANDDVTIQIFDGDTKGLWDQRDDRPPVTAKGTTKPFDTVYELYEDPKGAVAEAFSQGNTPAEAPLFTRSALGAPFLGTNAEWVTFYEAAVTDDAETLDERYSYTLRILLTSGSVAPLSGYEINGFKVAHNGRARLPEGTLLGFIGGAVDMRLGQGTAAGQLITEDPWFDFDNNAGAGGSEDWRNYEHPTTGEDLRNNYQGEWSFDFDGQDVCDLVLYEVDADWNKPIPTPPDATTGGGDPYDPAPTGIPPDDGLLFNIAPAGEPHFVVSNATFAVASPDSSRHGLYWDILAPNGDIPYSSDDAPLTHPSFTGAQQFEWNKANLTAAELLAAGSFQPTKFDRDEFRDPARQSDTIPWKLRWHGVDARNAIWMKASGDFGTNGGRTLTGYVFCDNDGDKIYDPENPGVDTPVAGAEVRITNVASSAETLATTNAAGMWTAILKSGIYEIDLVDSALKAQAEITLPARFDSCDDEAPDIPLNCDEKLGSLSGRVWCDNDKDGTYNPPPAGPDYGIVGATITVEKPLGTVIKTATTIADGVYSVTGLAPDTYFVVLDTSTVPAGSTPLGSTTRFEEVKADTNTGDVDFRGLCTGSISGHVYRELWDCNGKLDDGETVIPGVQVDLYDASQTPRVFLRSDTTKTTTGYFEFTGLLPGLYDVEVPSQTAVARLKPSNPVPPEYTGISIASGQEVDNRDFYFCPGALKVRVFLKKKGEACEKKIETEDTALVGAAVKVTEITATGFGKVYNGTTNSLGEVIFRNLDAGPYRVEVNGTLTTLYVPAGDSADQNTSVAAGSLTVVDSVWCQESCSILGQVVRKEDCVDWWFAENGEGINRVWVDLRTGNDPNLFTAPIESVQTSNGGLFEFQTTAGGDYTVSIRRPQGLAPDPLEDLTPMGLEVVYVPECPEIVRFVYGSAGIWTKVVIDTNCDGVGGVGVPGKTVTLEKLNAPKQGMKWTATTNVNGEVRLPTALMNGLLPGSYSVSIDPIAGLIPQNRLTQTVNLRICAPQRVTFRFCGVGGIEGYVYKEIVDCNGEQVAGEPGVNGVRVELYAANGTDYIGATTTFTNPLTKKDGYYRFGNLPRGTYVVRIQESDWPADTSPSSPPGAQARRTVIPPAVVRLDLGFCPDACLYGYVFKQDPGEDCDGTYDDQVDTALSGIVVTLVRHVTPQVDPIYRTTDDKGHYEFCGLTPGSYTVSVSKAQPKLVVLSPSTALVVGPFDLSSGDRKRVDFGFCSQEIHGTVFQEPEGNCNGIFDDGDVGIADVRVRLEKLDEPGAGRSIHTRTDGAGDYSFTGIPAGRYEISIPTLASGDPQTVLVGLTASSTQPLSPTLLPGQILRDQDFGYCPILKGKICGRVWKNPWDKDCDKTFDLGDVPLQGVTVTLSRVGTIGIRTRQTNDKGRFCFRGLPAGRYIVSVPGHEPVFADLEPNGPTTVTLGLPPGGSRNVNFPYCEKCVEDPCCKGNMHEVVVVTKFWIDDCKKWYDVYATFYDECVCPPMREIDYAGLYYTGDFPGATTGYNEVITIEDVEIKGNWAIVKIRLTAQGCWFPRGFFGNKCRTLEVLFNGKKSVGKTIFRCEYVRPGSWFTSSEDCPFPECPEDGQYPEIDPYQILDGAPGKCNARYLVLDTYDWKSWIRCNPKKCRKQSETCKCGYNLVEFELDYWVSNKGKDHRFLLELSKAGTDVIDGFMLDFTGDLWEGEQTGWGHYATLKKVKLIKKGTYADLWRATLLVRACDRKDGNPRALPSQLNVGTTLDDWAHDYWLDLSFENYYSRHCLELGRKMYGGNFTGVTILRWLSVEDAAWCKAYRCPPKVCGDKPCAPKEEELIACGCEK